MRKLTTLMMAAGMLAVLAVPASASAKFQHNGGNLAQNADVEIKGPIEFHGEIGGVTCASVSGAQLLASQTTITVKRFEVDLLGVGDTPTSTCSVDATLHFLGCTDVNQMTVDIGTPGNHWTAHVVNRTTIDFTTKTIQYHLHGGIFCPKTIQLTPGTAHLTMTSDAWTGLSWSGTFVVHTGVGSQEVTITGQGNVSPAGTYGSL